VASQRPEAAVFTSAKDASIEPESATSGMPVSPVPGSLAGGPRSGF
jgi:hypothetical protein